MLKLTKIVALTLCLVCTGLIALPTAQAQRIDAPGGVDLNGEGAVDLAGDTLVVSGTGYFNLYTREGSTWTLEYTDDYTSHAGAHNNGFGQRGVAISDTYVWVNDILYTNPDTGDRTGAFWIYDY